MELEQLRQYYNREYEFIAEILDVMRLTMTSDLFLNEINHRLTSSCDCLSMQCDKDRSGNYKISFRPSSVEHSHGCDKCTVDMPTGTLHVNTEKKIDQNSYGPNACSLIFQWISKTKTLLAPDKWLLQKPQPISSLPIYVDFLPALESLKPTSPGAGDEHDYFIVTKTCNVCHVEYNDHYRWRKSYCMAEKYAFTKVMSEKHRRCYQIMKYLLEARPHDGMHMPTYHLKSVVLRHYTTCSDTTYDFVDCVMEILRDLLQAYKTKKLLSYQSNLNILKGICMALFPKEDYCEQLINKLCSVSDIDSWETFIRSFWRSS